MAMGTRKRRARQEDLWVAQQELAAAPGHPFYRLRVDFFDEQEKYLESRELKAGDVILLVKGGHGFEVLEELEMIEVKQVPYAGDQDKTRFVGKIPQVLPR